MKIEEINRLQEEIHIKIPDEYKQFIATYSDEIEKIKEMIPYRAVVWTDVNELKREYLLTVDYKNEMQIDGSPWPNNNFVIGTNGGGDYWFIDINDKQSGIYFWSHESQEVQLSFESFSEYMEKLRADLNNPDYK